MAVSHENTSVILISFLKAVWSNRFVSDFWGSGDYDTISTRNNWHADRGYCVVWCGITWRRYENGEKWKQAEEEAEPE